MKVFIDHPITIDPEMLDEFDKQFFKEHSIWVTTDYTQFKQQKCLFDNGAEGETFLAIVNEVCELVYPEVSYLPQFNGDHLDVRLIQKS
jgi:hypothetical protein